jgi:hypothetical protein
MPILFAISLIVSLFMTQPHLLCFQSITKKDATQISGERIISTTGGTDVITWQHYFFVIRMQRTYSDIEAFNWK